MEQAAQQARTARVATLGAGLAQDLGARLCHDLVGPLGTVATALDLLADEPDAPGLAREAVAELRRRLTFWRAACGGGPLPFGEVAALLEGMLSGGRARLEPQGLPADTAVPAPVVPLLLLGALLAGEALPRGGTVLLSPVPGPGGGYALRPEGRLLSWPAPLQALLRGESPSGARAAPVLLLARQAEVAGWDLALVPAEDAMALRLTPRV